MIDPVGGSPAYPPLQDAQGFVPSVPPPAEAEPEPPLPDPLPLGSPGLPLSASEAVARYRGAGAHGEPGPDAGTDVYA
jgi:hypothetical protein